MSDEHKDGGDDVPPVMSISADVTSLIGSKRKRNQNEIIRPILKGFLRKSGDKITWTGKWGLAKQFVHEPFSSAVITAPFHFERKCLLSTGSEQSMLVQDSHFNGFFCMQDLSKPDQVTAPIHRKFFEQAVLLRFSRSQSDENMFDVVGSGQNKFGKYLIDGSFNAKTEELCCARNYLPAAPLAPSPLARRKSYSPTSSSQFLKRSERVRKPSVKYRESFIMTSLKKKSLTKAFEFEGRSEFLKILRELNDCDNTSRTSKVLEDLEKKKIRSLKSAVYHFDRLIVSLETSDFVLKASKEIQQLKAKFTVAVPVVEKQPVAPPTTTSSSRKHQKAKQPKACDAQKYVSLFDDLKEIKSIDPLSFNPGCRLPDRIRSPTLTSVVQMGKVFDEIIPQKQDQHEQCQQSQHQDLEEQELLKVETQSQPALASLSTSSAASEHHNKVVESEELYPISGDVDYSDLSILDAATLKQLNEFVEFTCPSKGS